MHIRIDKTKWMIVKTKNRLNLLRVRNWLSKNEILESKFSYGVPNSHLHLINAKFPTQNTYTDVLCMLINLFEKPKYLELGVSFGKNFYCIEKQFKEIEMWGIDLENPSKSLLKGLSDKDINRKILDSPSKNSLITLKTNSVKSIMYIIGDVKDNQTWSYLSGITFQVIFSDAAHESESIEAEIKMMTSLKILDRKQSIIVWDDAWPHLDATIQSCLPLIRKNYPSAELYRTEMYGWLGKRDGKHPITILVIGNPNFKKIVRKICKAN